MAAIQTQLAVSDDEESAESIHEPEPAALETAPVPGSEISQPQVESPPATPPKSTTPLANNSTIEGSALVDDADTEMLL